MGTLDKSEIVLVLTAVCCGKELQHIHISFVALKRFQTNPAFPTLGAGCRKAAMRSNTGAWSQSGLSRAASTESLGWFDILSDINMSAGVYGIFNGFKSLARYVNRQI